MHAMVAWGVIFCWITVGRLSAQTVVGYVESLTGTSKEYAIHRAEAVLPVGILSEVWGDDRIVIYNDLGYLRLKMTSGEVITVERRFSPYTVSAVGKVATPVSNLVHMITKPLTWWHNAEQLKLNLMARAAGDPLRVPLLGSGARHIVAGERPFTLIWYGGTPPFALRVTSGDGTQPLLDLTGLTGRQVRPPPLSFTPGPYIVDIRDAAGDTASRQFVVVAPGIVPVPPPDAHVYSLPPDIRTIVVATWLAGQAQGQWALESFLRVAILAESFEPAHLLYEALAQGELPRLP